MEEYISKDRKTTVDTTKSLTRMGNGWGNSAISGFGLGNFSIR